MRKWSRYLVGVVTITGLLALVVNAGAETCKLEAKRLGETGGIVSRGSMPADYWFRSTRPQTFFMQIGGPQGMIGRSQDEGTPEFSKVIKKEPSTYNSKHPFRGVAKLGSQYFGFVFDAAPKEDAEEEGEPKSDAAVETARRTLRQLTASGKNSAPAYDRLHFDVNHNGDLTDDQVIKPRSEGRRARNYAQSEFPIVELTIEVDGVPCEYALSTSVYSRASGDFSYANASLRAACYREGEMVIDGKKCRVVVVDSNANGRYDDRSGIDESIRTSDGTVYPKIGDMLYVIGPEMTLDRYSSPYDPTSNEALHFVAKQVHVGGRFHDLKITPSGSELTLDPSASPVGYVTNANKGYRAVVYGGQGFLKVVGDESGKAPLPAGEWQLASYTIDKAGMDEPKKEQVQEGSLIQALWNTMTGSVTRSPSRPRHTMVSARATRDYPAVRVKEGETVELPFGEPYRAVVSIRYRSGSDKAALSMSLVGNAGEICSNVMVNGGRPAKPKFTIATEKGEVVDTGNFEYG